MLAIAIQQAHFVHSVQGLFVGVRNMQSSLGGKVRGVTLLLGIRNFLAYIIIHRTICIETKNLPNFEEVSEMTRN